MSEVCCKRCGATDHVKNGIVRGFQRYLCLSCGCNFTMTPPRGKPPAMKALALLLYAMGNVSFGSIARILGVSDVAVLNWVRDEARKLPEPSTKAEVVVVTLDEMWHFVKKRLRNCGFGEPMTLLLGEPSPGFLVAVMTPHAKSSSPKSASKARRSSPDWEGYHRLIPDDQLFTGKDLTVPIEQDNSNIRHSARSADAPAASMLRSGSPTCSSPFAIGHRWPSRRRRRTAPLWRQRALQFTEKCRCRRASSPLLDLPIRHELWAMASWAQSSRRSDMAAESCRAGQFSNQPTISLGLAEAAAWPAMASRQAWPSPRKLSATSRAKTSDAEVGVGGRFQALGGASPSGSRPGSKQATPADSSRRGSC